MPGGKGFVSKAQMRKFGALVRKGQISKATFQRWLKETPSIKKLPNRVKKGFRRKKKKKNSQYTYKIDRKMKDYGEIDDKKKLIRINPRKGDVVNTIIHENVHKRFPKLSEKKTERKAKKIEGKMSLTRMRDLLNKVIRSKKSLTRKK
jgi:hypothetical protein